MKFEMLINPFCTTNQVIYLIYMNLHQPKVTLKVSNNYNINAYV